MGRDNKAVRSDGPTRPVASTLSPVKGRSVLVLVALLAVSCSAGTDVGNTTSSPVETKLSQPSTTQPAPTSTTTSLVPAFDVSTLPPGDCGIDAPPVGGEPTVVVGDRLYGLGADLETPRCLLGGIESSDIEWGPAADRVRVGNDVHGPEFGTLSFEDRATLEWTAPTGTKVVVITGDTLTKVPLDGSEVENIKFLDNTEAVAYHPAGTHLLAIGTDVFGQYGLWFAGNDGVDFVLLAADEAATLTDPVWSWLNDPLFVARHSDGHSHIHRVEMVEGDFQGPILVDSTDAIDLMTTSPFDPVMFGYRLRGGEGASCVDGSAATVGGVDLPEPLAGYTSTPVGWLSSERLLILAYPEGCGTPADLWSFSAGFCPGSTYGAELLMTGIDGAAPREAVPPAPPSPDFTDVIDPAPA